MTSTVPDYEFTNLYEIRRLSDRELAEATFLLLSALSERLTGKAPVIVRDGYDGMPSLICGADGSVAWLTVASAQRNGSLEEQPHMPLPTEHTGADDP
jgi:hypothetical protein